MNLYLICLRIVKESITLVMMKTEKVTVYENGYQAGSYKVNPYNGKNKLRCEDDYFED